MPMEQINVRIDAETKAQAEEVLAKIGLAPSDAVRMLYRQLIMKQGLPFVPKVETPSLARQNESKEARKTRIKTSVQKHIEVLKDLANR